MDSFWTPIAMAKEDDVFFNAASPGVSNYVYEYDSGSSRPPSQFSANGYYILENDDGYGSNYVESGSSRSPSHFSANGSYICLDNEDYVPFPANEFGSYTILQGDGAKIETDGDALPPMPPNRTRSKMHDLAVKHRLITDQNTRGNNGVLVLSSEEKRTLVQEGYELPTTLPLTREQEEALKLVRRKIKNKLSAQESRRKRKEYIDQLEKKVHAYYNETQILRNRIKKIEAEKAELAQQVKRLQTSVDSKEFARV